MASFTVVADTPCKSFYPLYKSPAGYLHNGYKTMKWDSKELRVQEKRILSHSKLSELIIIFCLSDSKREVIMNLTHPCHLTLNLNNICEDPNSNHQGNTASHGVHDPGQTVSSWFHDGTCLTPPK